MEGVVTQLGIGSVFAFMIIKEFFNFQRYKKDDKSKVLYDIKKDCAWLKEVHDKKDSDGVYTWYIRKSLQDQVQRLADSINALNLSMHDIHRTQKTQTAILEKMLEKLK